MRARWPFRIVNFYHIPINAKGIYAFWYGKRCIYIGQAKNQLLKDRLLQHFKRSHNQSLNIWIEAYGPELDFCVLPIKTKNIDKVEKYFIRRWQPVTNMQSK
ncbi:GIY-YIG nuclease family protein [Nitrosomonas nitrosa]|uniref:GIY-YIG nuclease family protein n=1 Tax=Nitrosomonas nitrosa TaxID=52442 RepID=UPI0023F91E90|nr:hypothetical protein [Nitrosomonas nitrosa]MCO6433067.1 hypothetical protein [Nitrosomonas nitrosa]